MGVNTTKRYQPELTDGTAPALLDSLTCPKIAPGDTLRSTEPSTVIASTPTLIVSPGPTMPSTRSAFE